MNIIPKPNWNRSPDGAYYDTTGNVLCQLDHPPAAFRQGVEHGAQYTAKYLLELIKVSSEDMVRELLAIADSKPVTTDWK